MIVRSLLLELKQRVYAVNSNNFALVLALSLSCVSNLNHRWVCLIAASYFTFQLHFPQVTVNVKKLAFQGNKVT